EILAGILKVQEKEIYFTSGGTESNNWAIIGAAMANRRNGNHIITTSIEHASVSNPMKYLEEQGFRVTYLPVDSTGVLIPDVLEKSICKDTILVSIMYVNNEVGSVQPIEAISGIIKQKEKELDTNILFHVDAIQAFGKYNIYPKRMGIDLLSVSGHKIHGPKGIGFLFMRDKVKVKPLILGGGQQKGMRSGTENVPGIAGLGEAARVMYTDLTPKMDNLYSLKDYFIDEVMKIQGAIVNSLKGEDSAPHIVSVSFEGIRSEVLLHALEDMGVYISAGSACASNKPMVSATLQAMNIKKELLDSTVRFSFSDYTTKEELDYCIECLNTVIGKLRLYVRR
ncbi:MAG: cysteine desulfurase family protein, partial [Eubacterium sp.]